MIFQEKLKFMKPIKSSLIQTWDLKLSIDTIIRFAESCYIEQDQEFKFIYLILEYLNQIKLQIKLKLSKDETRFELNNNSKVIEATFDTKVQEWFNIIEIKGLNRKTTKENINQYPLITTKINYQNIKKRLTFTLFEKNINNKSIQPQYKYLESLIYLMILNGLEISKYFGYIPKENYTKRIKIRKISNIKQFQLIFKQIWKIQIKNSDFSVVLKNLSLIY
ncbi:unnamed protein product [Paramecium primaurelia]|uniref:Uncharacterized protein n=1 Tax=Paramecium primaurelia TaxID=5886 RepID=A0A8S1NSR7_PARPR|nr:unnamed protein product [Paramecium primaurelia]